MVTKTRSKTVEEANGGVCDDQFSVTEVCNTDICPGTKILFSYCQIWWVLCLLHLKDVAVNCQWSAWNSGSCSETCGSGVLTKTRNKTVLEAHGGACSGESTATETCNIISCPGTWSSWLIKSIWRL